MARARPEDLEPLSEQQVALMLSIWRRRSASTNEVLEDLEAWEGTVNNFNTYRNIQTQLKRLVSKGYLTVDPGTAGRGGKVNLYRAAVPKKATLRCHLERLVDHLQGDETALELLADIASQATPEPA